MCKYCEKTEAIWFRKKNIYYRTIGEYDGEDKKLGAIMDFDTVDFFKNNPYLSIDVNYDETKKDYKGNWFDVNINYCPFCGRNLKRKTLSQTIRAIMDYRWSRIHEIKINEGIEICSRCKKRIYEGENISYEGRKIYCKDCSKKWRNK